LIAGIANPIGQIRAGAMMEEHLRHPEAAQGIMTAIKAVLTEPKLPRQIGGFRAQ
jgi:tartrate dehydrogenase/decarboxylase/D-malate dehydrogenase